MSAPKKKSTSHWILGSFKKAEDCLTAIKKLRADGEQDLDIYSAYPIHGAEEALDRRRERRSGECAL